MGKIELGSEFNISLSGLKNVEDSLFTYMDSYSTQWYDYGRSAIRQVPIPGDKLTLIPQYICGSVVDCFDKNKIAFYAIDRELNIVWDDLISKVSEKVGCIFIAHYFGYLQDENQLMRIKKLAEEKNIVVIEDFTQSLFSIHNLIGDYGVASIRKWMATPMGGVLFTNKNNSLPDENIFATNSDNSRVYGMILKDLFLNHNMDVNSEYRKIFADCEDAVDSLIEPKRISDLARYLIKCVSINELVNKRKYNAKKLADGLTKIGIIPVIKYSESDCPFAIPLRVRDRNQFREYLMNNRIYCAIHWPFDGWAENMRPAALENANSLISLPIDQRYGDLEIEYLLDVISKYGGDLTY